MTDLREAAQQALGALEESERYYGSDSALRDAIQTLRAALEQPTGKESLTVPPEAQTEAEKIAYCAGWWAAMAKAGQQEPVARVDKEGFVYEIGMSLSPGMLLYTTPPPCPTCEALARAVMMDQTGRD